MKTKSTISFFLSLVFILSLSTVSFAQNATTLDTTAKNFHSNKVHNPASQNNPTVYKVSLKSSVTQYGITWTFEKPVRVGQFVNGDYYVVGPTTIAAIT